MNAEEHTRLKRDQLLDMYHQCSRELKLKFKEHLGYDEFTPIESIALILEPNMSDLKKSIDWLSSQLNGSELERAVKQIKLEIGL
jgi:hypothetical protein